MKVISIGRGEECNIVLDDPMISRRHAVLRLYPSGKIEIIDYSTNGTSINGVKLARETLTNIKRGTPVSFAGVKTLDWAHVPDPSKPYRMIAYGIIGFLVLIFAAWGIKAIINTINSGGETYEIEEVTPAPTPTDTVAKPTPKAEPAEIDPNDTKIPAGAIPAPPAPKQTPKADPSNKKVEKDKAVKKPSPEKKPEKKAEESKESGSKTNKNKSRR